MSETKRYYVRRFLPSGNLLVEKSTILDETKYIADVQTREEGEFEIVPASSPEYAVAVKSYIASE